MNRIVLDDIASAADLFPFTLTRSVLDIRLGILTIREKWERFSGFPPVLRSAGPGFSGFRLPLTLIPDSRLAAILREGAMERDLRDYADAADRISRPWDLFRLNARAIRADFELLTKGRLSAPIPPSNQFEHPENIFLEPGARVSCSVLNASDGPIYIGRDAEIMEGSLIRGPFALCEGAVVKMGSKIYGATTVGPFSTVGGEIKNSVILGYSNKGHDGYLGDSVIGEWCNLGAGTSNSNLKNNASDTRVWQPLAEEPSKEGPAREGVMEGEYVNAGMKCGLLMGDYSRCAINTSFTTGSVVGVCCNIFGESRPPKYVPSFTWGHDGSVRYRFETALRDIANWKRLKNHVPAEEEIQVLKHIFDRL
ncbi:MAG: putative sugar nucleotidyl transferase [Puia sp.]|nr:putative sugar nucleotidyl transferase [Puia sp.]